MILSLCFQILGDLFDFKYPHRLIVDILALMKHVLALAQFSVSANKNYINLKEFIRTTSIEKLTTLYGFPSDFRERLISVSRIALEDEYVKNRSEYACFWRWEYQKQCNLYSYI